MKMTQLEKRLVNRRKKAENNIAKIQATLDKINSENIKDVLEIGCGIGLVSAYLAHECGLNVYGTDFDSEEIKIAKEFISGQISAKMPASYLWLHPDVNCFMDESANSI